MAQLHPDILTFHPVGLGAYAERAVLEQLRDGLPEGFDVFHSVKWSTVDSGVQRFGEIDMVVVDPQGHLVLLEVKSGELQEVADPNGASGYSELLKRYGDVQKNALGQTNGQLRAMRSRLQREGFDGFKVAHLLILTHHHLKSTGVQLPRERVVDAKDLPDLCHRIRDVIHQGQDHRPFDADARARLLLFLANFFELAPDPTARMGMLNNAVIRLSEGLATWVPRIHSDKGLYVVEATAGSGKTQLALRMLRDGCAKGLRCMYVCYNRPLADHISQVAPAMAQVQTFHELVVEAYRRKHGTIDFSLPGIFDLVTTEFLNDHQASVEYTDSDEAPYATLDLLIIDEMQDMQATWVDALSGRLKSDGRMVLMGDSGQSIYEREPFDLAGAVHIRCDENYRSPRKIVEVINLLGLSESPVVPRCPEVGDVPDTCVYPPTDKGGKKALDKAVAGLLAQGVDPDHIAIITFAGQDRSVILGHEKIGGQQVRKFTRSFDAAGNPNWSEGDLLVETLYRFKGQAAPYVILCEIEFDTLDEKARRKLFVGMTRAQMKLVLVMSEAAEKAIAEAVNAE
jgi:hypothetical protein